MALIEYRAAWRPFLLDPQHRASLDDPAGL